MYKRIISAALSALLVTGTAACFSGCGSSGGNTFKTADKVQDGAILQAFSWDFNTIKASLPDIAAAGFSAVQTSPINECLEGEDGGMQLYGNGKWYYHYQPTDFKVGNYQLGTRDEFKELCEEADKYGIKIIVDIIANHTTPQLNAVSKDLIEAGGGSFDTLFHKNNSKDIKDYSDRLMCTTAKMGGLPDINTERPSFQEYFISFVNDCIACGADGFRYDTAKHIGLPDDPKEDDGFENNFWKRVTKDIDKADDMFIYGEVLQGNNDRIADYINEIGRTTSSSYGSKLRAALMNNIVDTSSVKEYWLGNAPLNMVTWVESHDNYINDGTAFDLTNEQIVLGWSIITARKDGTPLFFSRPYNCSMQNIWGMNRIGAQGDDIYKSSTVSAVNFFRTAMIGEEENLVNPNKDSTILMIERGKKGAVIVNTIGEKAVDFETSLADGKYVDRVDGKTEYTVKDGKLSCDSKIKGNSVVVLYNDGFTAHDAPANAGVAKDTVFTFEKDSMDVTLTLENADEGQYTISGGESKSFKDGDKVTLTPTDGGATILELTAENKSGLKTYEKLAFYKPEVFEVKKGEKIYFEKPSDWDDEINVYIYNESGEEIGDWPGTAMTKEADGKYSYTFEKDWSSPLVIFNDGDKIDSVQYPAERGLKAEKDKTYNVE
ncbi:MAG: alpha-amylase family glycosyl hydrolase [Ruminococcus sp.]|nr:alpha-amylase family glycosyl hydrolase [Ruminococcus sp.]